MKKARSKYASPDFQYVRFRVGGIEFGFDVGCVKEIIRYTQPQASRSLPSFVEGFIVLRSMHVPLVDLRKRFGPDSWSSHISNKTSMIIIASVDSLILGLIVDGITDISVGTTEVALRPERCSEEWESAVEATVEAERGRVLMLNPSALFKPEEKLSLKSPFVV